MLNGDQSLSKYDKLYEILNDGRNIIPVSKSVEIAKSIFLNGGETKGLEWKDVVRQLLPD